MANKKNLARRNNLKIVHLEHVKEFIGFSLGNTCKGEMATVLFRTAITSDEPEFYVYADAIARTLLNPSGISIDGIHHLLILIHKDLSADIYINNIPITVEMRPKRDVKKGEVVTQGDIADIRKLDFPDIEILDSDKIIFCFKVGWRFGLFFDVGPREWSTAKISDTEEKTLNLEQMKSSIGSLYRQLRFYGVFKSLETTSTFSELQGDGWFPFIELIGSEYVELSAIYQSKFDLEPRIIKIIDGFTEARLQRVTQKWWKHPVFQEKRPLIEAGLNAYAQDDQSGYINCIKNLSTEIEGILRRIYKLDTGKSKNVHSTALINHIVKKAKTITGERSLFLPEYFLDYLKDVVFADFDASAENLELSRNTSTHGVADPAKYTKSRALQLILAIDQIYFYAK